MNSKKLIKELENLMKLIGSKLLENFLFKKVYYYEKKPGEIVSKLDLEINNLIVRFIKKKYPGHNIISEESDHKNSKSKYCWIIDPLDGSRNFINKIPFFSTSIAIKKGNKTIAGFIYNPIQNEFFYGFKNKGSFLNGKKLSKRGNKIKGIMLTETPKNKNDLYIKQRKLIKNNFKIRQLGSSVLDIAYIAANRADIFWQENLNSWDFEAGLIIAKEANMQIVNKTIKKNNLLVIHNKKLNKNFIKKFLSCFT